MIKIAVANGDGIGPEIMDAVLTIFKAAQLPMEYEFVDMGKWVFDKGYSNGMTPEAQQTIESLGILFKGPMETPKGKGVKSVNVTARKTWNTYANKRTFQTLHGVDTVFSKAGIPIDITIVRENIEDTYGGIEHMLTHDVALSRRFITRPGSLQVIKYAFEMAKKKGATRITCGHKANIMKLTDGLFLEVFNEVAKEYPELKSDDVIVDDLCMKLVSCASGVIPLLYPLSKTHFPISTNSYSIGSWAALKIVRTASIISGPIPSPFATAIFIIYVFNESQNYGFLFKVHGLWTMDYILKLSHDFFK